MPVKKKTRGRPKASDPVKVAYVYLNNSQKKKILSKHKSLTEALIEEVLPKC